MINRYGPAPAGKGWVDIRLHGDPDDVEAWAFEVHASKDVWEDSESKPVRGQEGIVRRYIRARRLEEQ